MSFFLGDPGRLLALMGVALLAGLARGFSGFGAALIFIPLASALYSPLLAAPTLLVVDNILAAPLIPRAWREASRREAFLLALGALAGAPVGVWLLLRMDPEALRWGMSGLALAMLALLASGWRYHGRPGVGLSLGVGAVSGLCSGLAQMGGPPVVAYWLGGAVPAQRVRANIVLFFAVSGLISGAAYLVGGLLTGLVMASVALCAPAYGLGLWAGSRMFGKASETMFRRVCFALIGLAAVLGAPVW